MNDPYEEYMEMELELRGTDWTDEEAVAEIATDLQNGDVE